MRFIDLDLLLGDLEALQSIAAAEAARQEILAEIDPGSRRELIRRHRDKWVAFRPHFERIFGPKCWYVECHNPGTDSDIDHYRPKGSLAEDPTHAGYWWEALHWRNFRLSCHRANRPRNNPETQELQGKSDHFPLFREEERCRGPADDLCREDPILLDPTDPGDPALLSFDMDGSVAVAPEYENDTRAKRRVQESRIYLHLDWPRFKEDRRQLYMSIHTKVLDGDRFAARWNRGERGAREALKTTARDLIRLTTNLAPYSRAARAYVRVFREREWIKALVMPNIEAA